MMIKISEISEGIQSKEGAIACYQFFCLTNNTQKEIK